MLAPTPEKAVRLAIQAEELGCEFYRRLARVFARDVRMVDLFAALAEDEDLHREQFEGLLALCPRDFAPEDRNERVAVLRAAAMSEFFLGDLGLFRHLDELRTPAEALRRAIALERDTLGFYLALRDALGDSEGLDAIIGAERVHLRRLTEALGEPDAVA